MKTPYFLIKHDELQKNVDEFKLALADMWPNSQLAYSVKTNSLPWILRFMHANGIWAEAVSDEEYELALMNGYSPENIVFNGPIKGKECFNIATKRGSYVNIDSQRELDWMKSLNSPAKVGIRINMNPEIFRQEDIGYEDDGFRFGYSDKTGEFERALKVVKAAKAQLGLHFHCNSITRSLDVYKSITEYAASLIKKYKLQLSFIDIGGGFFGGVPGKPKAKEYVEVIKNGLRDAVDCNETKLIIEPGSALVGSAIDLHTSVVDVKETSHARIITTDGSRIHIDPLWAKTRYMYEVVSKGTLFPGKQIICGYTCMDHDRLMSVTGEQKLSINDIIIYRRVGAYSVTFGGPFIRYFPEVYVQSGANTIRVRHNISVEDYNKIES